MVRFPPLTENVMFVGFVAGPVLTEAALIEPSTARLLFQFIPPPTMLNVPAPVTALLKILNLSPTTMAGPALVTTIVPFPALAVIAPVTETTSLDCPGDKDLLMRL